ncbi:MAG TPA: acetyl-CoA carboxylase biotin carboxyl carrier protein [Solirubrobacteraceae bacterium]|nr:acetyl-CoA carboxylase biotin carboxyl carrier protein [Solirubrobacteraceae bacterium]
MALSDDDVREILRIIDESDVAELRLETEGFSLHVVRGGGTGAGSADAQRKASAEPAPARPAADVQSSPGDRAEAPSGSSAGLGEPKPVDGLATIPAPMLGTFYRAEAPGKPPFVEIGSRVEPDTTVCIIEVMKMMNSVSAGVSGTVREVIAENARLVEYGEPLFRVEPA